MSSSSASSRPPSACTPPRSPASYADARACQSSPGEIAVTQPMPASEQAERMLAAGLSVLQLRPTHQGPSEGSGTGRHMQFAAARSTPHYNGRLPSEGASQAKHRLVYLSYSCFCPSV